MPKQSLQCPFCAKTSSHGAGLASHIRSSHPGQHTSWLAGHRSGHSSTTSAAAADGFEGIVASLEQQKSAIERALAALREIGAPAGQVSAKQAPPQTKGRAKRRGITPEGRRRLAEAMKRRWAVKRTASQARKSARKKAA